MVMLLDEDDDERLLKKGPDLFKELLRVYPVAEVEDYFKAGQWKDDTMKTDLRLVEAHRREAGAPDPPALDEVILPEMPKVVARVEPSAGVRTVVPLSAVAGVRGTTPVAAGKAPGAPLGAGVPVPVPSPVADLRLVALFVAKWKLDAAKTKMLISKLPPERRRYVIQNFKATVAGDEAYAELEAYIEECRKTEAWGPLKLAPAAVTVPAANANGGTRPALTPGALAPGTAVPAPAGVKRPVGVVVPGVQDPSKRPTGPAGVLAARLQQSQATGRPPVVVGAGRPVVPGVRPGVVRPVVVQTPRPVGVTVRPPYTPGAQQPKAGGQGALVKSLLQRF